VAKQEKGENENSNGVGGSTTKVSSFPSFEVRRREVPCEKAEMPLVWPLRRAVWHVATTSASARRGTVQGQKGDALSRWRYSGDTRERWRGKRWGWHNGPTCHRDSVGEGVDRSSGPQD
jgi:hypothetical protein